MNKKGFTLVEIIITISLMVIIMIIAFPTVSFFVRKNDTKTVKAQEEEFISLAKLYVAKNSTAIFNTMEDDTCLFLSLDYMVEQSLLDKIPVLDKKKYKGSNGVRISFAEEIIHLPANYEYVESDDMCILPEELDFDAFKANDMLIPQNENENYGIIKDSSSNYDYLYEENSKYGDSPVINDVLIPVVYDGYCDGGAGCWRKADTTKAWYDYKNGNWANAVIMKSSDYSCDVDGSPTSLKDCPFNTSAISSNIINQYVWIPRLGDIGQAFFHNSEEITGFWIEKSGSESHDSKYSSIIVTRNQSIACYELKANYEESYIFPGSYKCGNIVNNIYGVKNYSKGKVYNEYTLDNIKSDNGL